MSEHSAESVSPGWLERMGQEAEERLRAMDPRTLGPAGKLLMGYVTEECPSCHGRGTVERRHNDGSKTPTAVDNDS